jgi:hypothetical protein
MTEEEKKIHEAEEAKKKAEQEATHSTEEVTTEVVA